MLSKEVNSLTTESFSKHYLEFNNHVINNGDYIESRNGPTREILDFKTTLTNPYKRLIGVGKRDINPFFLMAEAIWIFTGQCDVKFLHDFNSNLANYSDDGVVYHAPYGWRLRRYGLTSFIPNDSNKHNLSHSIDQIQENIKILSKDPESRRAVAQIWNSDFDLNTKTKDIPCNDMIFWKIRDGKLVTTISNRSNDLHWGLTTNIFQFSFISEMLSMCLGIDMGRQTHNSQSLHIYLENEICWDLALNDVETTPTLYDFCVPLKFDFLDNEVFKNSNHLKRLEIIDFYLRQSIKTINLPFGSEQQTELLKTLKEFSQTLYVYTVLLIIYKDYANSERKNADREKACGRILLLIDQSFYKYDVLLMSFNFFAKRMKSNHFFENFNNKEIIGLL